MQRTFIVACFVGALSSLALAQITIGDDDAKISCTNDSMCSDQFGEEAICDFEYCDCKNGSNFIESEGKCSDSVTSFRAANQKCQSDRDCDMEDSRCHYGECKCAENSIVSSDNSRCLQVANEVGWGCEEDLQCTTKLNKTTECREFVCVCKPGTIINNLGSCVEAKGLDAYCSSDDVCTTPNSNCQQGICACKEGFVADSQSQICIEVAQGYKSPCVESIQCTQVFGQHAHCYKKECVCITGHHFSDMHCWEDRGLNERCDRPDECYIAADGDHQKLQCTAGQCICKPQFIADLATLRCSGASVATAVSVLTLALLLAASSLVS